MTNSVYKFSMIYQITVACPFYFCQNKEEREREGDGELVG